MKVLLPYCFCSLFILLVACKPDTTAPAAISEASSSQPKGDKTAEIIEIYNAQVDGESYEVGALRYKEHTEYHGDVLFGTIYYTKDGSIRGKSIMNYPEGSDVAASSTFVDARDSVLSFYKHYYDDQGQKTRTIAYDPVNDEILREERFYYNKEGRQNIREIWDAEGNIRQRFNWTYDKFGNETAMMVDSGDNTPLMTHVYRITKYDDDKRWLEKWTFVDEEPSTFHRITRRL